MNRDVNISTHNIIWAVIWIIFFAIVNAYIFMTEVRILWLSVAVSFGVYVVVDLALDSLLD